MEDYTTNQLNERDLKLQEKRAKELVNTLVERINKWSVYWYNLPFDLAMNKVKRIIANRIFLAIDSFLLFLVCAILYRIAEEQLSWVFLALPASAAISFIYRVQKAISWVKFLQAEKQMHREMNLNDQ